ncbi:hypothetical protein Q1695_012623 [Nippostrongylus brasiliensis]|nr:hypothetical protein Q1695_012623 [Nippostrongylus brasiliensis]
MQETIPAAFGNADESNPEPIASGGAGFGAQQMSANTAYMPIGRNVESEAQSVGAEQSQWQPIPPYDAGNIQYFFTESYQPTTSDGVQFVQVSTAQPHLDRTDDSYPIGPPEPVQRPYTVGKFGTCKFALINEKSKTGSVNSLPTSLNSTYISSSQ